MEKYIWTSYHFYCSFFIKFAKLNVDLKENILDLANKLNIINAFNFLMANIKNFKCFSLFIDY